MNIENLPTVIKSKVNYVITIYDNSLDTLGVYGDGISLVVEDEVNEIGMAIWTVHSSHSVLDILEEDMIITVSLNYYTNTPNPSYVNGTKSFESVQIFSGIYRNQTISTDQSGATYHVLQFAHLKHFLSRHVIAYPKGLEGKTFFEDEHVSTIMYDLVSKNIIFDDSDRATPAVSPPDFSNSIDAEFGPEINYSVSWRSLLEVLQELGEYGSCDFDIALSNVTVNSVLFRFTVYDGTIGDDLTDEIIFDLSLDNLTQVSLSNTKVSEKTVGIVGGKGSGAARTLAVVTGPNQSSTNNTEVFVSMIDVEDNRLSDSGEAYLSELASKTILSVKTTQSHTNCFGIHYNLGDIVTVRYKGVEYSQKIKKVTTTFEGNDTAVVDIVFEDYEV